MQSTCPTGWKFSKRGSRRNWAGNPNSMSTVAEYNEMYKGQDHITMPYLADDAVIAEALKSIQG